MIIFAKICISNNYKDFILLFVHPAKRRSRGRENYIKQKKDLKFSFEVFLKKVAMTYSPTNICSTIGAVGLNFSVRDGKRWDPNAINRLNIGNRIFDDVQKRFIFLYQPIRKLLE